MYHVPFTELESYVYEEISDTQLSTPGPGCRYALSNFIGDETDEKLSSNGLGSSSM